jgi:hypothetical protein
MSSDTNVVERCPSCGQKLRFPSHLGPLIVTCPPCKHRWDWQRSQPMSLAESDGKSKLAAISMVPVVSFENTKQFFAQLSKDVEGGQPVTVETEFEKESEFPDELKQFIKTKEKSSSPATGGGSTRRPILVMALASLVGALLGLGIFAKFGGASAIFGSGVGAVFGLIVGAVSTAISSGSHKIEIVVDIRGKIIIRFNPVSGGEAAEEPVKTG